MTFFLLDILHLSLWGQKISVLWWWLSWPTLVSAVGFLCVDPQVLSVWVVRFDGLASRYFD
jgi:hypothetical protein